MVHSILRIRQLRGLTFHYVSSVVVVVVTEMLHCFRTSLWPHRGKKKPVSQGSSATSGYYGIILELFEKTVIKLIDFQRCYLCHIIFTYICMFILKYIYSTFNKLKLNVVTVSITSKAALFWTILLLLVKWATTSSL